MASRSHVDQGINERRLRPIYDCLDNGNNKKALQEADKLLKKQKDFLCAKALKALALARLGRQDEALLSLQEVHDEDPTDDPTLQAMTICYRELHKPQLIADAYERATKKDPQNEELLSHLFMSHVRNGDYKKQQQTAMALYKLKPKNPYYFWAIMSIVMQANVAEEKLAKQMLLPLAERMTEKFVNENKLEAEAEVQLYLMILEQQEKYEKAIEVMDGPLQEKLSPYQDVLPKRKAEFLSKLEKWPEANQAYKKLILGNPDQWSYYTEYFKSVNYLVASGWQPESSNSDGPEDCVDYTFEMAVDFLEALVEEQNGARDGRKLRGPYLAQIDLLNQLLKKNDPVSNRIGTMVDVLMKFYDQFGTKSSCFLDLSHVISTHAVKQEDVKMLIEKINLSLIKENNTEDIKLPKDLKQMNRHLCYSRLCHYFGYQENWSQQQQLAYVRELIERYHHALQFGANLSSTEFQPADNYCLLAAHTLISIWKKSGDERLISQVLVFLEQCLKNSPSNFQIKILLMKLYNAIGAAGATYSQYESVDIKHIQQETLGYLLTDSLLSGAFYSAASVVLGGSIRFFTSNYKDTVDYLISCYKFGSFTKIPELVSFRERVNNSFQYASVTVERMILDLLLETKSYQDTEKTISSMEIDPEKDCRPTSEMTDNRDIFIYRMYTEDEKNVIEDFIKKSFQEQIWWLKVRNLLVRIMAASYYLTNTSHVNNSIENNITNGEKRNMSDILSDLIASLKDTVTSMDKDNMISSIFPIQGPGQSRLLKYLQDGHIDVLIALSKLVLTAHSLTDSLVLDSSEGKNDFKIIDDIKNQFQAFSKRIQERLKNENLSPVQIKSHLEDFANTVETLGLGSILVSICHAVLKPVRNSIMRKGKKKKENVPQVKLETFQELTNLISDMETTGNSLLNLLNDFDTVLTGTSLGIMSLKNSENCVQTEEDVVHQVLTKVNNSYQTSVKEIRELLQSKVKYLQSLKW